jgi:hypothetical protein
LSAYDGSRGHGECGMTCTTCSWWRGTVLAHHACRTVRARRRDADRPRGVGFAADPDRNVSAVCATRSLTLARRRDSRSGWSRSLGSVRGGCVFSRALTVARCHVSQVSESVRFAHLRRSQTIADSRRRWKIPRWLRSGTPVAIRQHPALAPCERDRRHKALSPRYWPCLVCMGSADGEASANLCRTGL